MQRGIDHLVIAVRNLEKSGDLYERLGFKLTPRAQHPFGTDNRLAQMQGCFLELLSVERDSEIFEATDTAFSFPAFNRDFLKTHEGLSMLVLESTDEQADHAAFTQGGLRVYDPFTFSRNARQPDGSDVTVGFSLTFATDPGIPGVAFFTCRQWKPELFWKPEYQAQPNGAQAIAEVLLVAADPKSAADSLAVLAGAPASEVAPGEFSVETPRGKLTAMTLDALERRYAGTAQYFAGRQAALAGFVFTSADTYETGVLWREELLPVMDLDDGIWLAPPSTDGLIIHAI